MCAQAVLVDEPLRAAARQRSVLRDDLDRAAISLADGCDVVQQRSLTRRLPA